MTIEIYDLNTNPHATEPKAVPAIEPHTIDPAPHIEVETVDTEVNDEPAPTPPVPAPEVPATNEGPAELAGVH
jgi:hypothetical protein